MTTRAKAILARQARQEALKRASLAYRLKRAQIRVYGARKALQEAESNLARLKLEQAARLTERDDA